MTKREICERLMNIRDEAINYEGLNSDRQRLVANDLRDLLLDIAAPEEEVPKAEEKHPGVLVPANKDRNYPAFCLLCEGEVQKVAENRYYCPNCNEFISKKTKRKEEKPERKENEE